MSAESPKCARSQMKHSSGAVIVTPQHVTDPTILDSVAGFIHEVVPNSYNVQGDSKDQIQWAHFEHLDPHELSFLPNYDCEQIVPPPLILVLGYTTGIQVWALHANGEATEVMSWRHGCSKVLKVLPLPFKVDGTSADDLFAEKRPLIALCDTASPGPQYCALSFLSLKTGEQVKLIKFKNQILEVLANKHSVVVSFSERIAVFDALTLEDRCSITTCYLSPGLQPNPIALGSRWMAYAEKKLNPSRRSSGGNDSEGVQSYTATVLHAAKSLGRGLRELSETVASSLTGTPHYKPGTSPGSPQSGGLGDVPQKGVVTILDIESTHIDSVEKTISPEAVIAHFTAHTEAVVCLSFDPSGMLLLTADKRGHDFHLFRIQPHPAGPSLAAVHHLYILHRGDTTAKVQDVCFSADSRWVSVSTLRGTTHVFPVTSYGGNVGVRTHTTRHVVNKMSRFHRSAGLTAEGRSNSPVSLLEMPAHSHFPYHNPRFPPFLHPTVVNPLAQIRQPVYIQNAGAAQQRSSAGRQRLSSSSEDNIVLRVVACFASPRAYIDSLPPARENLATKQQIKPVESLFIMSCHGSLVQYDVEPNAASNIPKEKICDDTPIELIVSAKAQWPLQRQHNSDVPLPLKGQNLQLFAQETSFYNNVKVEKDEDHWLSQVEIVTHAGPHRRLWMGPQFTFKTYTTSSIGSPLPVIEAQPIDVGRSKPVNMPITKSNTILIEAGSATSSETSLIDTYHKNCDDIGGVGDLRLKEDLADAMQESPNVRGDSGGRCVIVSIKPQAATVANVVNPLGTVVTLHSDDETALGEEFCEDGVIHENCDEALFRPVVVPKPVLYSEAKPKPQHPTDRMITKNLDNTTGVAVKILDKSKTENKPVVPKRKEFTSSSVFSSHISAPKLLPVSSNTKNIQTNPKTATTSTDVCDTSTVDAKSTNAKPAKESKFKSKFKPLCHIADALSDLSSKFVPIDAAKKSKEMPPDIPDLAPLEDIEYSFGFEENKCDLKEDSDFASLESNKCDPFSFEKDLDLKADLFEDATDCCESFLSGDGVNKKEERKKIVEQISDNALGDDNLEDKVVPKKPRKPKAKLGVRLNVNKDNVIDSNKMTEEPDDDKVIVSKRSWNMVAAAKPKEKLIDLPEKENHFELLPDIKDFTSFAKKTYSSCLNNVKLIHIESSQFENEPHVEIIEKDFLNDEDLMKVEKSSDDEKNDSTPGETTTESDDSSKVPIEGLGGDVETENAFLVSKNTTSLNVKSNKKKAKKKRK